MKRYLALAVLVFAFATGVNAQTATLTSSASSYSASGGSVTFTATVVYPSGGAPTSVGFLVNLPAGWTFASHSLPSGANASASPTSGDRVLEWAFSGFPASQLRWTFVANYPASLSGTQTITVDSTQSSYRPGGVALQVPDVTLSPMRPAISSSTSTSSVVNSAFSYTITASEGATAYEATGLPAGLTLSGNVISGTPTTSGVFTISLRASNVNGWGETTTLTLTVGNVPEITSPLTASATAGSPFSYTIAASNSPTHFSATGLPAGLSLNASTGTISGTPSAAGTANVSIGAENGVGWGNGTLVITIAPNPNSGGPTITSQPTSQSVDEGATASFSVSATGATSYQWHKDGAAISGANQSTLTLVGVTTAHAGSYTVVVSNGNQSSASSAATLSVRNTTPTAPVITGQPTPAAVFVGGTARFSVTATGPGLSYQWSRNGSPIAGATNATLVVPNCYSGTAGGYSVVVTNSLGQKISNLANLDVVGIEYFGTFASNAGSFAIYIRPDRTGVFLGYVRSPKLALITKAFVLDENGRFRATSSSATSTAAVIDPAWPKTAAAETEYVIDGSIAGDGSVSGTVTSVSQAMSAPTPATTGSTVAYAGYYEAGASGTSTRAYAIVGAAGEIYVALVSSTGVDAGKGSIDGAGNFSLTTENNVSVRGTVGSNASISLTTTPAGSSTPTIFNGGNPEVRPMERLNNVSTRATAGAGEATLIVGFSIAGSSPKRVLIRGVGPTLGNMGVGGVIRNPLLKVLIGNATVVAENSGWSTGPEAAAIAAAAKAVGAFGLDAGSKDAAVLIYLPPGMHAAHLTTTDGATGIGLVEVYEVP